LLIGCARALIDARRAHTLDQLTCHDIDWARLFTLAQLHGVLPCVQLHLAQKRSVPEAFRDQLRGATRLSAEHNLFLTSRLLNVLTILERSGIEGMPFKGPTLAARLYRDVSFRQFGDLDLFSRPAAVMDARRV